MFLDWTKFLPSTTDLFYANGTISFNQINQGGMGDCYLMAASSAIAEFPSLVKNVFLTQTKNAAGIFGISLFIRGKPYHIALDDNIMFYNSSGYSYGPVYASLSDDKTAAWSIVIEKAWAKVLGNYLKTDGGFLVTAIRALTGVPTFSYKTVTTPAFDPVVTFTLLAAAD